MEEEFFIREGKFDQAEKLVGTATAMLLKDQTAFDQFLRARKAGADKPKIIRSEEDSNEKGMATGT